MLFLSQKKRMDAQDYAGVLRELKRIHSYVMIPEILKLRDEAAIGKRNEQKEKLWFGCLKAITIISIVVVGVFLSEKMFTLMRSGKRGDALVRSVKVKEEYDMAPSKHDVAVSPVLSEKETSPISKSQSTNKMSVKNQPSRLIAPFSVKVAQAGQKSWAKHLKLNVEITNSLGMVFLIVPPGEYLMGSPLSETGRSNDEQRHEVRINIPYYLATTEVTQQQWQAVMGTAPWKGKNKVREGDFYPATNVGWEDIHKFIDKLNQQEEVKYRLPTEAEWEYACRAGSDSAYNYGAKSEALKDYAWFAANTLEIGQKYAHSVGQKQPNLFGLYDMHGNVWEMCEDSYKEKYIQSSIDPDPGSNVIIRGGSWEMDSQRCRSAYRGKGNRSYKGYDLGFRLVLIPPGTGDD